MRFPEFQPWPKIARLNRDIIVTEKIDGTNAAVVIVAVDSDHPTKIHEGEVLYATPRESPFVTVVDDAASGRAFFVYAQSRTRFITPKQDNYGFAAWVERNADALVKTLGEGTHFGEWWGSGIQRKYGLTGGDKRFSLFNTKRWDRAAILISGIQGLDVVPVIYEGPFDQGRIDASVEALRTLGSLATLTTDFTRPEGIVVFHTASRESYKVTLEGDGVPKGAAGHALDNERIAA